MIFLNKRFKYLVVYPFKDIKNVPKHIPVRIDFNLQTFSFQSKKKTRDNSPLHLFFLSLQDTILTVIAK